MGVIEEFYYRIASKWFAIGYMVGFLIALFIFA